MRVYGAWIRADPRRPRAGPKIGVDLDFRIFFEKFTNLARKEKFSEICSHTPFLQSHAHTCICPSHVCSTTHIAPRHCTARGPVNRPLHQLMRSFVCCEHGKRLLHDEGKLSYACAAHTRLLCEMEVLTRAHVASWSALGPRWRTGVVKAHTKTP